MISRRDFLKISGISTFALYAAARGNPLMRALAASAAPGLSDPALQPKFTNPVPDALAPGFIYQPDKKTGEYFVTVSKAKQATGLIDPVSGKPFINKLNARLGQASNHGSKDTRGPLYFGF